MPERKVYKKKEVEFGLVNNFEARQGETSYA